jgi:hypothetical protein
MRILVLAALISASAVRAQVAPSPRPKIEANEILTYALTTLHSLPSGETHWKFLAEKNLTLSIGRDPSLTSLALSTYQPKDRSILINAEFLDGVYNEMDAEGISEPRRIAKQMGAELAPTLAHESCHAAVAEMLSRAAGKPAPDSQMEEALCLYEELVIWKELEAASPWLVRRTVTELDRSRDRIEHALRAPLLESAASHYPTLGAAGGSQPSKLRGPTADFRQKEAEKAITLIERKIRGGGAGLESWQESLLRAELVSRLYAPLEGLHPPRPSDSAPLSGKPAAAARRVLEDRLRFAEGKIESAEWTRWRARRHPEEQLYSGGSDRERLNAASVAAVAEAASQPDLELEGNPYFLRHARALSRKLGEDLRLVDRETTLLQEAKIRRLLTNSERLAAQGDDGGRRWSYLNLKRAELESREVWDMTPQWIVVREGAVIESLRKQLSLK